MEKLAGKVLRVDAANHVFIMDHIYEEHIVRVTLNKVPEMFVGKTLAEVDLRAQYGILVMLIGHQGGKAVPADAATTFSDGDKITVFGNYDTICEVFEAKEVFSMKGQLQKFLRQNNEMPKLF